MADLDDALFSEDLPTRDGARHRVAERAEPATIRALVQALDAPHKQTRKRAARLLGDMRPARVADPLVALLGDAAAPTRSRVAAARLLTALRPDGEPALAHGLA
ncbi:MAG: HEAT repeat domain-containing protein [Myxococcales bacterium]|nr:HEAT repeat domain-containing protein [Myxococcales bacterium]